MKIKKLVIDGIALAILGFSINAYSAKEIVTCPNLLDPHTSLEHWTVVGELSQHNQFQRVVLASTGAGCSYTGDVILMQIGPLYRPVHRQYWHRTGGGVDSVYCTESINACSFTR